MDVGREELIKIKEVLKQHPKGLSLSDISKLVGMNRHSVAKYMEMLTISGHVERRSFGPSKVYYLSQRVPISTMLSFSSDIIGTIDRNMNIVQVNDVLLKFFGFKLEDVVGQNISCLGDILPINDVMMKLLRDTLDGKLHHHSMRISRDGEVRYLRMKLVPAAFDDGTPGVVFIAEDVTTEKRAEMALQDSEKRYRAVVEDQTELIVRMLPDTTITFVNAAWCRFFGEQRDFVLGRKILDAMPEQYREPFMAEFSSVKPGQPIYNCENCIRVPGAGQRWMLWTYRGIYRGEHLAEMQVIGRDVTDRKQAELALEAANAALEAKVEERTAELTRSNSMIQTVLDTVPNLILVVDAHTQRISYMTPNHPLLKGHNFVGMTVDTILSQVPILKADGSPAGDDEVPVMRSLQRGDLVKNEEYIAHLDGEKRVVLMSSAPVYSPNGRITAAVTILSDITGRKQAEEALREGEERFRAVFDQADAGIAVANPEGYLVDSNPVYRETLGYTKEELRQKRIYDVTHPGDVAICQELERQMKEGSIDKYQTEKRYIRKDGRVIWGKLNVSAIRDRDGSLKYNLGVMEDITERKTAEDALRESEVRFRSLIQNSSDIIRILDKDGRIVFDSPSSEKILGYPAGYTLGMSPFEFVHPDDLDRVRDDLSKVYARSNRGTPTEFRVRKASGDYLEVESIGTNMIGVPGVDGIVVNTRPITERKRAGVALRESEASLKMAEEIAGLGRWDVDLATGKGHWSDITYRILGYKVGEIEPGGETWTARIHPDDRGRAAEALRMALQSQQPIACDYRIVRPDGEVRWVHDESNVTVLDAAGRPVKLFGTIQDITGRKAVEERLAATTRLLEAALQASPLAMNAIDTSTNVLLWNRMAEQLFGWTKEEVLGKPIPTIHDGGRLENEHLQAMVNGGKSLKDVRIRRKRKDGTLIDLTIDASPLYDENGKLLGALGVFRETGP